ncbi:MAG TPA: creatininase family protein [Actinomycetota bacterium]|nr:creatininase family protein [Actinomycetota bacterium]
MSEVEWWRLRAAEIRERSRPETVVIVPVASTEQHGPHLTTEVDCALVGEIARRAARIAEAQCPVLVTPVLWTGLAEHHMSLGGTITLDFATFSALVKGVCRSLVRQGFGRILLLNGHGGNIAALTVIVNEIAPELDSPIATATYWLLAAKEFGAILEDQPNVRHACEAETSMMLAIRPERVDMLAAAETVGPTGREVADVIGSEAAHRWRSFEARTSHGVIGVPRRASAAKGEALLQAAAEAVSRCVIAREFWDLEA